MMSLGYLPTRCRTASGAASPVGLFGSRVSPRTHPVGVTAGHAAAPRTGAARSPLRCRAGLYTFTNQQKAGGSDDGYLDTD